MDSTSTVLGEELKFVESTLLINSNENSEEQQDNQLALAPTIPTPIFTDAGFNSFALTPTISTPTLTDAGFNSFALTPTIPTPTPALTDSGFNSWPNYEGDFPNGEIWSFKIFSPRPTPAVPDGRVILALPARTNDHLKPSRARNAEAPRTFKIYSIEIGSWKIKSSVSVSLSANIHFGWQNLLWQIEERGERTRRIMFKWGNISEIKVSDEGERPGLLAIKLKEAPRFLCENGIHPVTRRVVWIATEDFTNGEARSQWHVVECAPDSIKYDVKKILESDKRLSDLSKEKSTGPESNLVGNKDGLGGKRPEGQALINHGSEASPSLDPSSSVQPPEIQPPEIQPSDIQPPVIQPLIQNPVVTIANVPGKNRPVQIPDMDPRDFEDLEELEPTIFGDVPGEIRPKAIPPLEMDPKDFEGLEELIPPSDFVFLGDIDERNL